MFEKFSAAITPHLIFGDIRLKERFSSMLIGLGQNFGKSIPQSFPEFKDIKAVYDFFSNKRMQHFMVIGAEQERLVTAIAQEKPRVVLAVQDTTELDFTGKRAGPALGSLSYVAQKGFLAHNHCLFTADGIGLGVFAQTLWGRPADTLGKNKASHKNRPIEEKESFRWLEQFDLLQDTFASCPQTTFIDIGDQESDIQEVLQARRYGHVHYILRSRGDRNLSTEPKTTRAALGEQPIQGCYTTDVRDDKTGKVRKARLEVRFMRVEVNSRHRYKRDIVPVEIGLVMVSEIGAPMGTKPVEWILSTSLPLGSLEDAFQIIAWYCLRWKIEVFHYVLKQGCAIEKLQLETPNALEIAIATYSLLAMQVLRLRALSEKCPDAPMEKTGFEKKDYQVAATFLNAKRGGKYEAHKTNPTVADFAKTVAQLGGSTLQKDKPLGIKALWLGLRDLNLLTEAFDAFSSA
jgi:hypothetical protein